MILSIKEVKEKYKDYLGISAYELIQLFNILQTEYKDYNEELYKEHLINDVIFLKLNKNKKLEYSIVEFRKNLIKIN